jgi:hypothetical protein
MDSARTHAKCGWALLSAGTQMIKASAFLYRRRGKDIPEILGQSGRIALPENWYPC